METDPHAPQVKQLADANDWAALIRYWIAHSYGPALEEAVKLIRQRSNREGAHWGAFAQYLNSLLKRPYPIRKPPRSVMARLNSVERSTHLMLDYYSAAIHCEYVGLAPVETQLPLLQGAIPAAQAAKHLAQQMGDLPLVGRFVSLEARGWGERRDPERSRAGFEEALELYRKLARDQSEPIAGHLALTHRCLGVVQNHLDDPLAAHASFEAALPQRE